MVHVDTKHANFPYDHSSKTIPVTTLHVRLYPPDTFWDGLLTIVSIKLSLSLSMGVHVALTKEAHVQCTTTIIMAYNFFPDSETLRKC